MYLEGRNKMKKFCEDLVETGIINPTYLCKRTKYCENSKTLQGGVKYCMMAYNMDIAKGELERRIETRKDMLK